MKSNWDCCADKSNIKVIQRCQNIVLRNSVTKYWYDKKEIIHRDLIMTSIQDKVIKLARKRFRRLDRQK